MNDQSFLIFGLGAEKVERKMKKKKNTKIKGRFK